MTKDCRPSISEAEFELLLRFENEMTELLNDNTHKGPIVVEGDECDFLFLHRMIAKHALELCEHSERVKKGQVLGTRQTSVVKKACLDIANLAFIYKANVEAKKS